MDAFVTSTADVRIPRILYGTAWKKDDTESLVRAALLHGFRGIDTACQPKHYHEPGVGAGVASFLFPSTSMRPSISLSCSREHDRLECAAKQRLLP